MVSKAQIEKGVETRKKIYDFIKSYIQEKSYPPSFREIGKGTGIKSMATVHYQLHHLKDEGVIDFLETQPRTIRVLSDLIE
jgi:repressor LexA